MDYIYVTCQFKNVARWWK